jgi:putative spermidine/putrescine transport system permease protein
MLPVAAWAVAGQWRYPAVLPQRASARGVRLLVDPQAGVLGGLATSVLVAAVVAVLASLVGVLAGRALGLHRFRGRRVVLALVAAPAIVPPLAVLLGMHVFFIRYGLADTAAGVVLVHLVLALPYATLIMAAAFAGYDVGYEDQARLLGAGPARAFVSVTLPVLTPFIAVAAFFAFLISWSEYVVTLLIGGGAVETLPLLLFAYVASSDTTAAAAVGLLLLLPPLGMTWLTSRYLVRPGGRSVVGFGTP